MAKLGAPKKDKRGKWRIRWTDENGQRRGRNFETYQEASFHLKRVHAVVAEIQRGFRSAAPTDRPFSELLDYWIDQRLPHKRSQKDDLSIIRAHLRPALGAMKIREITVHVADKFSAERSYLNKKTVANILTLLISLLRLAVDLNWLTKAPNIRKPKTSLFSQEFRYLRSNEEINQFLEAAKTEGELTHLFYLTAIFTGMRAGELAALRFSKIRFDGARSMITVDQSFGKLTKSGRVRHIPILAPLLPALIHWRTKNPLDLVFPNSEGGMHGPSARIFQEVFHRVLRDARLPGPAAVRTEKYIVFHSLRHTFASHWIMKGGDIFKLQKILGHASMAMTLRYAHLAPDAFSGDFNRLGNGTASERNDVVSIHAHPFTSTGTA